jgi:hypothetical protein
MQRVAVQHRCNTVPQFAALLHRSELSTADVSESRRRCAPSRCADVGDATQVDRGRVAHRVCDRANDLRYALTVSGNRL